MNSIKVFKNNEFGKIRTVEQDGIVWFVAKDVCDCLGLTNATVTVSRLDDDEVTKLDLGGQVGITNIVNEMGLYNLILRSDKPEAKRFKRWITHEVLPSIRKHGGYMQGQKKMTAEELMAKAVIYADSKIKELEGALGQAEIKISYLEVKNTEMQPKADYFDELVERNLLTSFRETAKALEVPEKKFIQFLLNKKYIYRDKKGQLMPFARDKCDGLFEIKESKNDKTAWTGIQTLITPKGREVFRLLTCGL